MKYISFFERFNNNDWDKIEKNVTEIFVELIDIGYVIEVRDALYDSVSVYIKKPKGLDIEDVKDYILMFIDYMSDLWSGSYVTTTYEYEFKKDMKVRIKDSSKLDFNQWSNQSDIDAITCFVTKHKYK